MGTSPIIIPGRSNGNIINAAPQEAKNLKMAAIATCISAMWRLQDLTHKFNYVADYEKTPEEIYEFDQLSKWYVALGQENLGKLRDWARTMYPNVLAACDVLGFGASTEKNADVISGP